MKNTTNRYTYSDFASDIISLANGDIALDADLKSKLIDKATALQNSQATKAAYNATHTAKAKGPSAETLARVNTVRTALTSTPKTTAEINATLNSEFTPLQIANTVKFIDGVTVSKVVREVVNSKGLRMEKEYTAYSIA